MSGMSGGSLQPTWNGYVATARDALILFEACLNGSLHHVPRRPHDRERSQLIKSGCIFIYEENASGIKRWTDGVPWSPSRILGNFLVYRELLKPFPPGEKKRATKKGKRPTKPGEPYPRTSSSNESPTSPTTPLSDPGNDTRDSERALIGSLVDSYAFKDRGLVKKTMSVNVHGVHHHLVSYYTIEDVNEGLLTSPSKNPQFADIQPRHDLVARQSFRAPLDGNDTDGFGDPMVAGPYANPPYGNNGYNSRPNLMVGGQPGQSQQGHMGAGYPGMPLSNHSMPPVPAGLHSYAQPHMASPQSYYPQNPGIPSSMKQDSYESYQQGYQPAQKPALSLPADRRSSHPQQQQYPSYRSPPLTQGRPNGIGPMSQPHEHKPLDAHSWDRPSSAAAGGGAHSGIYNSPIAPQQPHSAGPYSASHSAWNMAPHPNHNLPRMDGGWNIGDSGSWNVDQRHNGYNSTPQHNP